MNKRATKFEWNEPVQRWLFIGMLLFATLAVPAIAVVSRIMADAPMAGSSSSGGGGGVSTHMLAPALDGAGGGGSCTPTLMDSDSILIKNCSLKK